MIKNILLAAVLTVSAFAATHAQAATGQTGQSGFVSGGGSYEFTVRCIIGAPYSKACRKFCLSIGYVENYGSAWQYCNTSYRGNKQTSNNPKQPFEQGFTQGKFRSN